jgi:acyl-CoA thioester hydrolase
MPRVKIGSPEKYFDTAISIPVRITDINYGDHVGNDSLISIIHEARMQFLQQHSFNTELDIDGTGLIMSDLTVEFKSESFYSDVIKVKMGRGEISKVSFELFYTLTVVRNSQEVLIANAKTSMVCYDYKLKKVVEIPGRLRTVLA